MLKFKLLYFKNLLDIAFLKFFQDFNHCFTKDNDIYIFSADFSSFKIVKYFKDIIIQQLQQIVKPLDRLQPEYYILLGACLPKDNIMLKLKNKSYFPAKLNKLVNSDIQIKYLIKEKDIRIDFAKFNKICLEVFEQFFTDKLRLKNLDNLLFLQHKNLDCYSLFKAIKYSYGKSACINLHKEIYSNIKPPIIAINDLICQYSHKNELQKLKEFKQATNEVKQFIDRKFFNG